MTIPVSLVRVWIALIILTLGSTAISIISAPDKLAPLIGAAILILAWMKARLVLATYMGLAAAPAWQRGFDLCLGLFCAVLLALYLVPIMF